MTLRPSVSSRVPWLVASWIAGLALGCAEPGLRLGIEVRTDAIPEVEFASVVTELFEGSRIDEGLLAVRAAIATPSRSASDFGRGQRVASFEGLLPGTYTARVRLLRGDARTPLLTRRAVLQLSRDRTLTLTLDRGCLAVECPDESGGSAATECVGGRCVFPSCVPPDPTGCEAIERCREDADCASELAPCAEARCADGVCLALPRAGACGEEEHCAPERGGGCRSGRTSSESSCGTICRSMEEGCEVGYWNCQLGEAFCDPFLRRPVGDRCAAGVCDGAGRCVDCAEGASCSQGCALGTFRCSAAGGGARCELDGGLAALGARCAPDGVCLEGQPCATTGLCTDEGACVPDGAPGVIVLPERALETSAEGRTDELTIQLTSEPLAPVRVELSTDAPTRVALEPSSLVLEPGRATMPRVVVVRGLDDGVAHDDVPFVVRFALSSDDVRYEGLPVRELSGVHRARTIACSVDPSVCDDRDACTLDACVAGVCQQRPVEPDDGDACTLDACDPVLGVTHEDIPGCCRGDADCPGALCRARVCVSASCGDGERNGAETDVDCGGETCAGCGLGGACAFDRDCLGEVCVGGRCVECRSASTCPGRDGECRARTCVMSECGEALSPAGTVLASQALGDCRVRVCDATGEPTALVDSLDVPIDGNPCTLDLCIGGVPSNPPAEPGTRCGEGLACDGRGGCVSEAPRVVRTSPAEGVSAPASRLLSVTFSTRMDPSSLVAQTTAGRCTGTVQLSLDDFVTCVALRSELPAMSEGGTMATFGITPGLLVNRTYELRVDAAARSEAGVAMDAPYRMRSGFIPTSPNLCDRSVVIAEVYPSGELPDGPNADYVVLHNRGSVAVEIDGWSLQLARPGDAGWQVVRLAGAIEPGGWYLVQLTPSSPSGEPLPSADVVAETGGLAPEGGTVALLVGTEPLRVSCPLGEDGRRWGVVIDLVGYGLPGCAEGLEAEFAADGGTRARARRADGCADVDDNRSDFEWTVPTPRNAAARPSVCGCFVLNESDAPGEVERCELFTPTSFTVRSGAWTPELFGRMSHRGVTMDGMEPERVRAQVGWGSPRSNPQYEGWVWWNARFVHSPAGRAEYAMSFPAPLADGGSFAVGYRFSLDEGVTWTVCDVDGAGRADPALVFELESLGTMTVLP